MCRPPIPGPLRVDGELLSLSGEFAPLAHALAVDRERDRSRSAYWSEMDADEPQFCERPLLSLRLSDTERESFGKRPDEDVVEPVVR